MKISEKQYNALPSHLRCLFSKLPNSGSDEVLAAFPDTGQTSKPGTVFKRASAASNLGNTGSAYGAESRAEGEPMIAYGDSGSAARFFYCAKASRKDRDEGLEHMEQREAAAMQGNMISGQRLAGNGTPIATPKRANTHPTVKPTDLMRWLCRLVTPPGGTILDPFMGSGSTGKAALLEGFQFIGCEREDEYMPIAEARIAAALRPCADNDNQPVAAPAAVAANSNQPDLFGSAA